MSEDTMPELSLVVCDEVANRLSFHNAAEGDTWRAEESQRTLMWSAWICCEAYLRRSGLYREFRRAGSYLIPPADVAL